METKRNLRIRNAIQLALGAGLAATMVVGGPLANAAEEEAAELERVQVTGSRISRLDVEGATPVVTISREDLDNSGYQSVADYLRSNSFNSFGSLVESSGNTAQGQALLNLRGIGSNRTLVLIDGRRLPGSPVLDGQVQNLNTIPFAAVERIEILSDGASAIYGSDAIGGVVNIILRKDFEGGEVTVRGTDPDRPGGEERGVSVVAGFAGDRGRMTWALEADHQGIIYSRDRFYTANALLDTTNPTHYNSWSQISAAGRNIVDFAGPGGTPGTNMFVAMASDCNVYGTGFDFNSNPGGQVQDADGTYCVYDYTGIAAETASLDRLSSFMTAEYEINSDLTFTSQILATRVQSFGRYAPSAAGFFWTGPDLPATTIDGVTYAELNPGDLVYYRFDNTGVARDTWQTDVQLDMQVGLQGFYDGIQWNANYQYDQYDMNEWGAGYVSLPGLAAAADLGWDPRLPDQEQFSDAVPGMRGNSNRRAETIMQRVEVGAQFDGPMMAAGPALFYVGGEYRDEDYMDETLAQMEAGNVLGTAGGSSGGSRSAWAASVEASLPLTDTLELSPALRYDSYSDFGTNVSYKLSARWQPTEYLVVRGSYGTGFRAPSLDELYQAPAQSFAFAYDLLACTENATNPGDLGVEAGCLVGPDDQYETFFGSNPNLDAETSTQYLLGAVLDLNTLTGTDVVFSLDYYYTEIEDVITQISSQDAFWLEYIGIIDQFPGVSVTRNPPPAGDEAINPGSHFLSTVIPVNFRSFDTSGIDFRTHVGLPLGAAGDLSFDLLTSYVLEYNSQDILVGPLVDQTGRYGAPQWRANLDITWVMGPYSVALISQFIPSYKEFAILNPDFDGADPSSYYFITDGAPDLDSWSHHNLVFSYEAPWDARISVGVNNLTDEDPVLDSGLIYDDTLNPIVSRATVFSYTQRF